MPNWHLGTYFSGYGGTPGDFSIRLNRAASGVPYSMECKTCDANFYRSSSTACTACPANSVSLAGSIGVSNCKCKPGYYMQEGVCVKCATDKPASPLGSTSSAQCEVDSIVVSFEIEGVNVSLPQSEIQQALPSNVLVNSYDELVASTQSNCPQGYYCPADTTTPIACPAGTYNNLTNQNGVEDCIACPPGDFCPVGTSTPIHCAAGSYRSSTGGVSQGSCAACPSGNFCPLGSVDPTNCPLGTYRASGSALAVEDCLTCPVGVYCPLATTTPSQCAAGSYRSSTGAASQNDCATCIPGSYCPVQSVNPISCFAGTYNPYAGMGSGVDCQVCSSGKYSLDIARSTDCPLCDADHYCPNSTTVKACPANTVSSAGSSSLLHCRCEAGFKCSYTKKITAVVTLNTTAASFNNPQDPVRIAFIAAVAAAAGVNPAQVTIGHVRSKLGGRRLLSLESQDSQPDEFIDVHTSIDGAIRLHRLDLHLAGHSATLHQGHTWQEAHRVLSSAVLRRPVLST